MKTINWGIIGCGDVTELKSGPAFNKINHSKLVAAMRRNAAKAKDYAQRHHIPKWYDDAYRLINDEEVNAIYIATPPLYHEEYTIAALQAGKPVYVEKPVSLTRESCINMLHASEKQGVKLSVAHYRRALPVFNKVKTLIDNGHIGDIRFVQLRLFQPAKSSLIANSEENWRLDPAISGGGLFHDLAPHQLDLMTWYFGKAKNSSGFSANQAGFYPADDIVSGEIVFENGIIFQGLWCFTVPEAEAKDECRIIGSKGMISFPVFESRIVISKNGEDEVLNFVNPQHIQQPMIEKVVDYFLDKEPNPCSANEAEVVMGIMDKFTKKS